MPWPRVFVALQHLAVFVGIILLWHVTATQLDDLMYPTPERVLDAFERSWNDGTLWAAVKDSNTALLIGLLVSIPVGVLFGIVTGYFWLLDRIVSPYVNMMLVVPMVAVVPILVIVFGIGTTARVAVVVMFAIPDILVNTRGGVRLTDRSLLTMGRAYGGSTRQLVSSIVLPTAFPSVMTGVRIGIGRAITGMIVVELTLVASGMGGFIMEALGRFRSAHMMVMIIVIALEAVVLTGIALFAERRVMKRMGA